MKNSIVAVPACDHKVLPYSQTVILSKAGVVWWGWGVFMDILIPTNELLPAI